MDDSDKFNKKIISRERRFSHLNMECITDADYAHATRVCKDFQAKSLSEYHDSYIQSDTLILVEVFNNFHNMCLLIFFLHQNWYEKQL